jgi:hypothetical protein
MKRDNREKRNRIILSVVIAFVMILSTIGFFYGSQVNENEQKYTINNKTYSYTRENNQYVLELNKKEKIGFYYLPFEINMNITDEILNSIQNSKVVYITFDPDAEKPEYIDLARFDLAMNFLNKNIYVIEGTTKESQEINLPIITCENATAYMPVIYLQESNITNLINDNNCIRMQGKNLDFIKFRDLMLYKLYGIL